jgi:hypothetical protein
VIILIILFGRHYSNWPRVAKTALRSFDEEAMGRDEAKWSDPQVDYRYRSPLVLRVTPVQWEGTAQSSSVRYE